MRLLNWSFKETYLQIVLPLEHIPSTSSTLNRMKALLLQQLIRSRLGSKSDLIAGEATLLSVNHSNRIMCWDLMDIRTLSVFNFKIENYKLRNLPHYRFINPYNQELRVIIEHMNSLTSLSLGNHAFLRLMEVVLTIHACWEHWRISLWWSKGINNRLILSNGRQTIFKIKIHLSTI